MDDDAPWRALEPSKGSPAESAERPILSGRHLVLLSLAIVALADAVLAGSAFLRPSGQLQLVSGQPAETAVPSATTGLVVQVCGAVVRPGVYTFPPGSRVVDAIAAAGGYSPDVDPLAAEKTLNLAAKLTDAEVVYVPRRGDESAAQPSAGGGTAMVNLNTASAEELDALPGIGPATAAKIIASREQAPFTSVDDLVSRKLVSATTLAGFRDRVTV